MTTVGNRRMLHMPGMMDLSAPSGALGRPAGREQAAIAPDEEASIRAAAACAMLYFAVLVAILLWTGIG